MDFDLINPAESIETRKRKRGRTLVDLELLELVVVLQEVHLGGLRLRVRGRRRRCRCHQRCALRRGRADERGASRNGGGEKGSGEKRGYRGREHQPASRAGRRSGTETLARPGGAVRPCGGWLAGCSLESWGWLGGVASGSRSANLLIRQRHSKPSTTIH